jgi:predicted GNAT family N-acyltransferase
MDASISIQTLPGGTEGDLWEAIRTVRVQVFIVEQSIAPDEEWDDLDGDPDTVHLAAVRPDGTCVGVARCFLDWNGIREDGHLEPAWRIGRMAVVKDARGLGIGLLLLDYAYALGRNCPVAPRRALLSAQTYAIPFYARAGFRAFGEIHMDAGIPHRWMEKPLTLGVTEGP